MRIAWRTVGSIITRVGADVEAVHDRFARLAAMWAVHLGLLLHSSSCYRMLACFSGSIR